MKGLSWTNFVLGLWLLFAPLTLAYSNTAAALWEDLLVGILIAALALWRALGAETREMAGVSWIVAVLGIWVLNAPSALGYAGIAAAFWNDMIVGLVVAVLGTVRALEEHLQSMGKIIEQQHGPY